MSRFPHNTACQYLYSIASLLGSILFALHLRPACRMLVNRLGSLLGTHRAWRTTPVGEGEIITKLYPSGRWSLVASEYRTRHSNTLVITARVS